MPHSFEFSTASKVIFGAGRWRNSISLVKSFGDRALVVTGANPARWDDQLVNLRSSGLDVKVFAGGGEPTVSQALQGAELARDFGPQVVIGLGGGSAIDLAKAVAAFATNSEDPMDYLEVVGLGRPLKNVPLPGIAVPTTAGTGAEVTKNAVLLVEEARVKVSLRHDQMLPRLAIIDPELAMHLPRSITVSTGMDALTQLIEPWLSKRAQPMSDLLCCEGMRRIGKALPKLVAGIEDLETRGEMALASLWSGMALANAGLGAVHGLAGPLGGFYPGTPHGVICASLLLPVLEANGREAESRPELTAWKNRTDEMARCLTGQSTATFRDGLDWLRRLQSSIGLPSLSSYGACDRDFDSIIRQAKQSSSMKSNPVDLSEETLLRVLCEAIQ